MKKRLLHLQLLPLLSGVQRFSLNLLEALPRDDYEIYVASAPGGPFVDAVQEHGWNYLPIRSFRHPISPWDILSFIEIYLLCRKYSFDIVHTNSSKPGLLGRIAARLAKVPLVLHTSHGTSFQPHQPALLRGFYAQMEKLGNRFGDYNIFVNHSDRLKCLEMGLLPDSKAITIYNAMAEDKLEPHQKSVKDDSSFIIGSTIRFSDQKNVIKLILAACKACARSEQLKFIILGDGEHFELCKSLVATNHLNERIILPGWDSDVAPWLAKFDAFTLYSRWEAMPFSIIEAMHASLPIIGSDILSIRELVDDSVGWLVPLDDEDALINTLIYVASNPEIAYEKGDQARVRIRSLCYYPTMISAYRRIYESEHDL
ncbi:MAG: glycosyltransferase family 4 protein [Candidatus Cloacimonetes bacterium]|nr:glycosyltransferase family 4 protein [Candidatus Cloacimonadota bacterium]HOA29209.1 glycosyltransferase family 4 protein [Candidatus Cloacimonadota bacterium]